MAILCLLCFVYCTHVQADKKKRIKSEQASPKTEWTKIPQNEQQEITHYTQDFVRERGSSQILLGLRGDAVTERLAFLHDEMGTKFFLVVREPYARYVKERMLAFTIGGRYGSVSQPQPFMKMIEKYDSILIKMDQGTIPPESSLKTEVPSERITPLLRNIAWRQFGVNGLFEWQPETWISGCGAVAMAQVMYFYRYPNVARGTVDYDTDDGHHVNTTLEGNAINWSQMKDYYKWKDRDSLTIDPLIKMCGIALHSKYGPNNTNTQMRYYPDALKKNFLYSDSVRLRSKGSEGEFVDAIRREVGEGRPCILCDNSHIFVADGVFDEFLHFNLGWSGVSNGWFRTLTPTTELGKGSFLRSGITGIIPQK